MNGEAQIVKELEAIDQLAKETGRPRREIARALAPSLPAIRASRRYWYEAHFQATPEPTPRPSTEQVAADAEALQHWERLRQTNPFEAARYRLEHLDPITRATQRARNPNPDDLPPNLPEAA